MKEKKNKITTTHDLANLIKKVKFQKKPFRIHPATKTFQALRIFINNELEEIKNLIDHSINIMAPGARLSFNKFSFFRRQVSKKYF